MSSVRAVAASTLMLNCRYDTVYPYETSQLPFFNYLGTPARDKKMVMSNTGHILQFDQTTAATLEWFDKYLSGKTGGTTGRQ